MEYELQTYSSHSGHRHRSQKSYMKPTMDASVRTSRGATFKVANVFVATTEAKRLLQLCCF